jgi:hypothetical protein
MRPPRALLIGVLTLIAVAAPAKGGAQNAPTSLGRSPTRSSFAPLYVASLDPVVRAAGLEPLRTTQLPAGSREVRLWLGGGLVWPQDLYRVVSRNGRVTGEWYRYWYSPAPDSMSGLTVPFGMLVRPGLSGQCVSIRTRGDAETCEVRFSREPDWSALLQQMSEAGVWTLPDETELPSDSIVVFDGWVLTVELRDGKQYRAYNFSNPQYHRQPEAKQAVAIADALRALSPLASRALAPGEACKPPDAGRVRAWHVEWDFADLQQRARGLGVAQSGILRIPPTSRQHVSPALATGSFLLTVGQLRKAQSDTFMLYDLELKQAGRGDSLRGRLINLAERNFPGDSLTGVLGRQGGMAFGRADAFLSEDGESYDVTEIGPNGFRGWFTCCAVVPEPLAYFCAERVR